MRRPRFGTRRLLLPPQAVQSALRDDCGLHRVGKCADVAFFRIDASLTPESMTAGGSCAGAAFARGGDGGQRRIVVREGRLL